MATESASHPEPSSTHTRWPYRAVLVVLLLGTLVTVVLSVVSGSLNAANERRLLVLRSREVASALTAALPEVNTPLSNLAAVADTAGVSPRKITRLMAPYVGTGPGKSFVSMSLWRLDALSRGPVSTVGIHPRLAASEGAAPLLRRALGARTFAVVNLLHSPGPALGFASVGASRGPWLAYAESSLPRNRTTPVPAGSAFSDLDFALYLGSPPSLANLLISSSRRLPLGAPREMVSVPFGDSTVTVVVRPREPLGGSLPAALPWSIALLGALLTLGAAALTVRLISRRRRAEQLAVELEATAEENQRLYSEQRSIATTLQHALLPDALPHLEGVQLGARYDAGIRGIEIGGDWYDVIGLEGERLLLVVGDVSGRGLRAATSMAALRFAIHAYAEQGDTPDEFLPKLSKLRRLKVGGQIATAMCAVIDFARREVRVTSAGHLPALLIADGEARFLAPEVGPPIGFDPGVRYHSGSFDLPDSGTLLGYTDGLVERRGETLDVGLERLRDAAARRAEDLEPLMTRLLNDLRAPDSEDDTALAAVRWSAQRLRLSEPSRGGHFIHNG